MGSPNPFRLASRQTNDMSKYTVVLKKRDKPSIWGDREDCTEFAHFPQGANPENEPKITVVGDSQLWC